MAKRFLTILFLALFNFSINIAQITTQSHPLARYNYRYLVVKFHEGSIQRADVLASGMISDIQVTRLFTRSPFVLNVERQIYSQVSGNVLEDLNTYYRVILPENTTPEDAQRMIDQYKALSYVETVYAEPFYMPASVDIPPTTPDFTGNQTYFQSAPVGLDVPALWSYPGGRGTGVRVIDVEGGWHFDHEDLPIDSSDLLAGINFSNAQTHGTIIMGIFGALDNNYGITGIAPEADYKVVSVFGTGNLPDIANAVNIATANTSPGDIILIELQALGPASGQTCTCQCDQFEQIPMEYWQANYDAIRHATSSGRIVLQVAGNGGMDLDHSRYGGRFNRSVRDSGAILVTGSNNHSPFCWSNTGSRVDLHHWGGNVVSTGLGDLFFPNNDINQAYTANGAGSSSATAITAGGATGLQGVQRARGNPLTPATMRDILRRTGYPATSGLIGTQADMYAALNYLHGYGTIYGVVMANGSPTSGVVIHAGNYGSVTTDSAGRFRIGNIPLNNSVLLYADGRSVGYTVEWWADQSTQLTATPLSVNSTTPVQHNIDFSLTNGTTITGTVYNADTNQPVENVAVRVDGFPWEVCTAIDGTYTLDGVASGEVYTIIAGGHSTSCSNVAYLQASQSAIGGASGINFRLIPLDIITISEQEFYQEVAQQLTNSPITFALFDFKPTHIIATLRVNDGTAQSVTVTVINDEFVRFEISGGDTVIRQELPSILTQALDTLAINKGISPSQVLMRLQLMETMIQAEFIP